MSYRCDYEPADGYGVKCGAESVVGTGQGHNQSARLAAPTFCRMHGAEAWEDNGRTGWNPRAYASDHATTEPESTPEVDAAQAGGVYYVGASDGPRKNHALVGPFGTRAAAQDAADAFRRMVAKDNPRAVWYSFGWSFMGEDIGPGRFNAEFAAYKAGAS